MTRRHETLERLVRLFLRDIAIRILDCSQEPIREFALQARVSLSLIRLDHWLELGLDVILPDFLTQAQGQLEVVDRLEGQLASLLLRHEKDSEHGLPIKVEIVVFVVFEDLEIAVVVISIHLNRRGSPNQRTILLEPEILSADEFCQRLSSTSLARNTV